MVDLLEFLRPNASPAELILLSNICVYVGWSVIVIGFLSTIIVTLLEKSFFFEGVRLIVLGLIFTQIFGTHSNVSLSSFFFYNSVFISIL